MSKKFFVQIISCHCPKILDFAQTFPIVAQKNLVLAQYFLVAARKILILPKFLKLERAITRSPPGGTDMIKVNFVY